MASVPTTVINEKDEQRTSTQDDALSRTESDLTQSNFTTKKPPSANYNDYSVEVLLMWAKKNTGIIEKMYRYQSTIFDERKVYQLLDRAAEEGLFEVIRFFIEKGFDDPTQLEELLETAAYSDHQRIVVFLLNYGLDSDLALAAAEEANNQELINFLINRRSSL